MPPAFSIFSLAEAENAVRLDGELLGELALAEDLDRRSSVRGTMPAPCSAATSTVRRLEALLERRRR